MNQQANGAAGQAEGLARNIARDGLDEYTYRVATERGMRIAHRFEFGEAWIDEEGIDEILCVIERVMTRVRQSRASAPAGVPLHLVK